MERGETLNTQCALLVPTQAGEQWAPVPTLPLARTTDPETSKASARALQDNPVRLGRLQEQALLLVEAHPGCTANELERIVQLERAVTQIECLKSRTEDPTQYRSIARRLSDLAHATKIHRSGTKVDPESGRKGECWWPGPDPKELPESRTERG